MSNSRLKRSRRAVVLLAVLVCLGVSLALMTICFKQALQMRRELKLECQQMQSAWLMEAAVQRTLQKHQQNPAYSGEIWKPALDNTKDYLAEVVVERIKPSDQPEFFSAQVRLTSSFDEQQVIRRSLQWPVSLPSEP